MSAWRCSARKAKGKRDNEDPDARAERLTVERERAKGKRDKDPETHGAGPALRPLSTTSRAAGLPR